MIREPYVGMPIIIGGNPGHVPDPAPHQQSAPSRPEPSWSQGTGFDARFLGSLPIAMTYTPMQQWKTTYTLEGGLQRGTIFPELDLPFEGGMRR